MGSLSGVIQRPLVAAAAVAAASFSTDFSDKLPPLRPSNSIPPPEQVASSSSGSLKEGNFLWPSQISVSRLANLSFVTRVRVPVPNINLPAPGSRLNPDPALLCSSIASSNVLRKVYQSAGLERVSKPAGSASTATASAPDVLYRWHLPDPNSVDVSGTSDCSSAKTRTFVVLLGWLGSRQKHLKRYAEWYTSRGYNAITFTFPMSEILSYQVGGKAEQEIESLVNHLADWLEEGSAKNIVFHTFSNTGWLTYGAILEKFQSQDPSMMQRIKGCIVDSAPVAAPDPQVWASGFSAAFLKKQSVATKGFPSSSKADEEAVGGDSDHKPAVTETVLLLVLEKLFGVVLNLPTVNRRLSEILKLLSNEQPKCPQLYIYSSADRVIPAEHVESFIEKQKKEGHPVRACNFVSTPHVDHFRNDPKLYTAQLTHFLEDWVVTCCKSSQDKDH